MRLVHVMFETYGEHALQASRDGLAAVSPRSNGDACATVTFTRPQLRPFSQLFDGMVNLAGNVETGDVYPDRPAPIVTTTNGGHAFRTAPWGLPSPPHFHSRQA